MSKRSFEDWDKQPMNISVVGIGRLGLCFCLTLEKGGYSVTGCDIREDYVKQINEKTFFSFEPGVNDLLHRSKNFVATTDMVRAVDDSRLIFVTVATYSEEDGSYDVSQVDNVVNELISLGHQETEKHLIICSNVNPGYCDGVQKALSPYNWQVSYNPETIAQGTILENQSAPDCVYIGADNISLRIEISEVYEKICANSPKICEMDRLSAELTKVSLNCFLTCKISFANMVGDLATKIGADPRAVLSAVGSDSRINNKFFKYGFGWGGPCFPRDTRAFSRLARDNNMPHDMCVASSAANDKHLSYQVEQFLSSGQREYVADSVPYKKRTVILEESQQLKFAIELANAGVKVYIKDCDEVQRKVKEMYGDLFIYV